MSPYVFDPGLEKLFLMTSNSLQRNESGKIKHFTNSVQKKRLSLDSLVYRNASIESDEPIEDDNVMKSTRSACDSTSNLVKEQLVELHGPRRSKDDFGLQNDSTASNIRSHSLSQSIDDLILKKAEEVVRERDSKRYYNTKEISAMLAKIKAVMSDPSQWEILLNSVMFQNV